MEQLGLNWFDVIGAVVVALSGIMGLARGLIREMFTVIGYIGAAIAAFVFAGQLQPLVVQLTALDGDIATVGAGLAIFLFVFIVITMLTDVAAKWAHQSTDIGGFDRASGLAFGVLRGVLFVALFVLLVRQAAGDARTSPQAAMPEYITEARTYPIYGGVAGVLEQLLPNASRRVSDIIKGETEDESPSATAPVPPAEAPAEKQEAPADEE